MVRQFVRIIAEQSDHLNALVSDLLDVARIQTGSLPVSPAPAEVAALVDRARNAFISAGGRNNLEIDIEPDLPLVTADRRRMVQVIGNLLSNAARNSPESSVIRVTAVGRDVHVAVSVSDQGRGIPAEDLPRLFLRFSRVQPRSRAGTRAWAWPSARGSWRPTGAASGPRATGRERERASPSPCPRCRKGAWPCARTPGGPGQARAPG